MVISQFAASESELRDGIPGNLVAGVHVSARELVDACVLRAAVAQRAGDYGAVLDACREALPLMPECLRELACDRWGMPTQFPVLDHILRFAPVALDGASLDGAGQLARSTEALRAYRAEAVVAGGCLFRVNALYGLIGERPGVMQATLVAGWPYAATVLDIAAAMGIVRRTRVGASFGLEMIKGHGARRPLR